MQKHFFLIVGILYSTISLGQVGINTEQPKVSLDIMGLPTNMTIPDGIIAPRLDGDELKAKDDLYSTEQTGAIIYVTEVPNPSTIKTQNITAPGYYYFNGDIWVKFSSTNSVSVNVENGLTQGTNTIKLGGNLVEPTIIETSANNTLSITGLQSVAQENVLMVSSDGTLSKSVLHQLKGTLDTTYYKQGTSQLLVAAGSTSDVPGVAVTHTVPSSVSSQTLTFTITGYASKSGAGVSGSGQGVFALFQDNVKISSAYVSVSTGDGSSVPLLNLPVPCVILRSVTLTPGTYTFNVKFSAWASGLVINKVPSNYAGYNNDTESMLTKMHIAVYNN